MQEEFEYIRDEELAVESDDADISDNVPPLREIQTNVAVIEQIVEKKKTRIDLPQGLKTFVYSFLTMTDLIEKISRLSTR